MNTDFGTVFDGIITGIVFFGVLYLAIRYSDPAPDAPEDRPPGTVLLPEALRPGSVPDDGPGAPPRALKLSLLIERCSDPQLWYAGLIGKEVPYVGHSKLDDLFISRQPEGYTNIVRPMDCRIIVREVE